MQLRLALYSDQSSPLTDEIDHAVLEWLPAKGATIGYLPSSPDPDRSWFSAQANYYRRYGIKLRYFGLETEYEPVDQEELFRCDAIHLTGGNTFQFYYWLRKRELIQDLQQYARRGSPLIGVSAGSILMTSEIDTSLLCGDQPYRGETGGPGLGLVDFRFAPHFDGSEAAEEALLRYSSTFEGAVYAVSDGGAILVHDGSETKLGQVRTARQGKFID